MCPAGKYCPSTTNSTEISCSPGYFSFGGAASCSRCPSGWKCPNRDGSGNARCLAVSNGLKMTSTFYRLLHLRHRHGVLQENDEKFVIHSLKSSLIGVAFWNPNIGIRIPIDKFFGILRCMQCEKIISLSTELRFNAVIRLENHKSTYFSYVCA